MNAAFPIATDAHDALARMKTGTASRAVREKEAESLAGAHVAFVTQSVGPLYETKEDALAAFGGVATDPCCKLVPRVKAPARNGRKPVQPAFRDGERWPRATAPIETVWQLSVSYWKIISDVRATALDVSGHDARNLRKKAKKEPLSPEEVKALTEAPLISPRPQKALDFGLFDFIPPDNPGIVIADE